MPSRGTSLLYMRDAFTACCILSGGVEDRKKGVERVLQKIKIPDTVPGGKRAVDELAEKCPWLWSKTKSDGSQIVQEDLKGRKLSRPLGNMMNWMVHIDDPKNAKKMDDTPWKVKRHLKEVTIWLSDLMLLHSAGYNGYYFNRITRRTELVPWAKT